MSTDLTFLRRRVKRAPTAGMVGQPLSPVPLACSNVTLTRSAPAVRLTRYASAIGSLQVTGADQAVIETVAGDAFDLTRTPAPHAGNRPLAELHGTQVTVGLRHLRRWRRIALTGHDLTVTTHTGLTVRVAGHADLGIHVVAGHLELRRDTPSADLTTTYALGGPA